MKIGFLIFPGVTAMDFLGPHEVLGRLPQAVSYLIAKTSDPVQSDLGLTLTPHVTFGNTPAIDILVVPGGPGINHLLSDQETLAYIAGMADKVKYVAAVCTGALVLGAAGLLKGRQATTHWMSHHFLEMFGAKPVDERVVIDGKVITAGGVTSGIDLGLVLADIIAGRETAESIQLFLEYDPHPPFNAGSPKLAGQAVVAAAREEFSETLKQRTIAVSLAAGRL